MDPKKAEKKFNRKIKVGIRYKMVKIIADIPERVVSEIIKLVKATNLAPCC